MKMNIKIVVLWFLFCFSVFCKAEQKPFSKLSFFENPLIFGTECAKIVPKPRVTISLIKRNHAVIFSEDQNGVVYLFAHPSAVENKKLEIEGESVDFSPEKIEARFYDTITTKDGTSDDLKNTHKRVIGGKFRFQEKAKVLIYFELLSAQGRTSFSFSKENGIWTVSEKVTTENHAGHRTR